MTPPKPENGNDNLPSNVKREAFGQRTLFDWFFVVMAISGAWTAAAMFTGFRSDMRDLQREKVSHLQLMRWTMRAAAESRGELGKLPMYEPPDEKEREPR